MADTKISALPAATSTTSPDLFTLVQGGANKKITFANIVASLGGSATWGAITGTLSNQTDLQSALNAKENSISAGTTSQYYRGDKSFQTLNTAAVAELTNLYFTDARARNALSVDGGSDPLDYDSGTGVFSMPQATTSTDGWLSSTDWNTFNSPASITFPITAPQSVFSAPSYSFSETSTDTGMGSPSDGVLNFSTNGVLAFTVADNQTATFSSTVSATNFIYPDKDANTFLAGPTTGSPATPDFRAIQSGDIPNSALPWPLLAPNGSAGSPSYGFQSDGDQDTGMYTTGDGQLNWSTNGAERMHLDEAGNLTITGDFSAANYPPTGTNNTFAGFDGSGNIESVPGFLINTTSGGMEEDLTESPNDNGGGFVVNNKNISFTPLQNSPNEGWNIDNFYVNLDAASSGFTQGTNGNAVNIQTMTFNHGGTGSVGNLAMHSHYFGLGNGTDPISVKGITYSYGFGDINDNVTVNGQVQGYGFQPNFHSGAILTDFVNGFYDASNMSIEVQGYSSFSSSPTVGSVANNHNFTSFGSNPNIGTLTGNASYTGLGIFPNIGTVNNGGIQCISVNPNVTLNNGNVTGLNVNVNGVTNYAGAQGFIVVQDITYTFNQPGTFANSLTVEYTDTVPAGSEVAILTGGTHVVVSIQSGVSTATQVAAAIAANFTLVSNLTAVITGTAGNAQVTFAETNFAGGIDPGTKKAADFTGDVSINGALSFTGALSIGQLTSFASVNFTDGGGAPQSIDSLITSVTAAASSTTANADAFGINTAMLMNIGDNATVTTAFLGVAALGLPAVLTMGTGSTIDRVAGALFALSLDASATGGTVGEVDLCRALALPNGATTVTKLKAYAFDLPFGSVGTTTWGVYMEPTCHNFMAGDLKIGGTDVVTNASTAFEIESTTKAFLNARMDSTARDALTAVNGMQIYNSTTDKLQVYAGGSWQDLN